VETRGLDFYDRLVDGLLAAGIAPWATLYHWDLPQALEDLGGWPHRDTAHAFVEYADVVARRLGDRVKGWITHNEPWCAAMLGYRDGVHAPGRRDWPAALATSHHLLLSHGWAVPVIRSHAPGVPVGITLNLAPVHAASGSVADREAQRWHDGSFNRWFLDPLYGRGYPEDMIRTYLDEGRLRARPEWIEPGDLEAIAVPTDFLGVNYYYRQVARSDRVPEHENAPPTVIQAPRASWTEMDWEVYPAGMWELLLRLHLEYAPPAIYITENGASWSDGPDAQGRIHDARRIDYFRDHLAQAHRALRDGVPLAGYFAWSLLDNFEWAHGYRQRFGIVWVDAVTGARSLKDSARWYRQVATTGSLRASHDE
ncbi:MAG: family 1 glycosylhydrolase, partial [Deltaproteobacteria bacterium]|nr:family 1 glycosylhydrolase [Nannocystaceae bacterium]